VNNLLPVVPRSGFEIPHGAGESVGARLLSPWRQKPAIVFRLMDLPISPTERLASLLDPIPDELLAPLVQTAEICALELGGAIDGDCASFRASKSSGSLIGQLAIGSCRTAPRCTAHLPTIARRRFRI
jgi:hypothetical protein